MTPISSEGSSEGGFPLVLSDGGRHSSGWTEPDVRDCGVRAVAHVTGRGYAGVRTEIVETLQRRPGRAPAEPESVESNLKKKTLARILGETWVWVPTHKSSPCYSGGTVRFVIADLPTSGRQLVSIHDHYSALIDGVIYDTFDPTIGAPVVHGYFTKAD